MRITIVALGDSVTAGYPGFLSPLESPPSGSGDERSQYEYWMMKEHPEWRVLNRGISGERTDQMLARFERHVVAESPRIVVVFGGVNDIYQGYPLEFVQRNLAKMYSSALGASIDPLACTVPPYSAMGDRASLARRDLNAWIRSASEELGIPFCDTAAAASDPGDPDRLDGSPDGYHPDVACYRRIGDSISRAIAGHLRSAKAP